MSEKPHRVRRLRERGWKMPANTVYVGRPTKWGNPYVIGQAVGPATQPMTRQQAIDNYREYIVANLQSAERFRLPIKELRGKDLACWCHLSEPCHADVLLEIANEPSSDGALAKKQPAPTV